MPQDGPDHPEKATEPARVLLGTIVACDQALKVGTLEFWPPIDDDGLRKALVSSHTGAQHHHARTVGGWVKCEVAAQQTPRVGVGCKGGPGATKHPTHRSTDFD